MCQFAYEMYFTPVPIQMHRSARDLKSSCSLQSVIIKPETKYESTEFFRGTIATFGNDVQQQVFFVFLSQQFKIVTGFLQFYFCLAQKVKEVYGETL